jgi:hypothetical protein
VQEIAPGINYPRDHHPEDVDMYYDPDFYVGIDIEKHYEFPQDIEWALEKDKLYIVQSRPITTL